MGSSKTYFILFLAIFRQDCFCQDLSPDDISYLSALYNIPSEVTEILSAVFNFKFTTVSANDVQFLLYLPTVNETVPISSKNCSQVMNMSNPTVVIIHGWTDNPYLPWIQEMAAAYHQKGDSNVIAVNWTKLASQDYISAASSSQGVGFAVGDFVVQIVKTFSTFLNNLHVIGHSMGGQVAGFVGKRVISKTGEKIDRITGLDAAGPLFEIPVLRPPNERLDHTDATFVDLIHTQVGVRGVILPYGQVDFYVNFGVYQPNCTYSLTDIKSGISCGHQMVHVYYTVTILKPKKYPAVLCKDNATFFLGLCGNNENTYMGEGVSRDANGTYFVFINSALDSVGI